MGGFWAGELGAFAKARELGPSTTYRDWQPTKWQSLATVREELLAQTTLAKHPISTALELGCGSATLLIQLSFAGVECTGVDRDPDALALAYLAKASLSTPHSERRPANLTLKTQDFTDPHWQQSEAQADLVMSIGVIEHFEEAEQRDFLALHAALSKRWILIGIPNQESPLFRAFLLAMEDDNNLYEDAHHHIDVPDLATSLGLTVRYADGCHVFLSRMRDNRFADSDLIRFQEELRQRLTQLDGIYAEYPRMDLTAVDIDRLAAVEKELSTYQRTRYGFLLWYLIDKGSGQSER